MSMYDQVCSLELSKKLKDLGVPQDSLFFYSSPLESSEENWCLTLSVGMLSDRKKIAAFTSSDLGKMLPSTIKLNEFKGQLFAKPKTFYLQSGPGYHAESKEYSPTISYDFYMYDEDDEYEADPTQLIVGIDFTDTNEANLRARMLIWLIENGHIKVDKV